MKYLSLFTGIGGFELGIQQAYESNLERKHISEKPESKERTQGWVGSIDFNDQVLRSTDGTAPLCIGYSEIDKYAIQIYQQHFPNHTNYGDITTINPADLPDFDFLCGGFPCQAFSIAGKRKGFDDTRGTLFFDIARILRAKKPRLLLLENVKGLLSHDNGNTFKTIIATLDELGYDLQWQVLNSKNHGVPQNRERVFIIGHLRGTPRPQVFPFGESDEPTGAPIRRIGHMEGFRRYNQTYEPSGSVEALDTSGGGGHQPCVITGQPKYGDGKRTVKYVESDIVPTIRATQYKSGDNQPKVVIPVLTPDRPVKRQNGRRFKEDGDPSFTLTSQDKHGVMVTYDDIRERKPDKLGRMMPVRRGGVGAIRRLTPMECERLQGFPDGWTEGVSDTQRYKTLGNAVTVNVIRDIMTKLLYGNL